MILNVLSIVPFFGPATIALVWCSSKVIVYRVFTMHYLFGVLTGLFVVVHIFTMHSFTSSNPLVNVYSAAVIPFYPLIFKDLLAFFALLLSAFACTSYFEPELLGNCENLTPANPLLTPQNILPEWYYLCFYCCLRCLPDKTVGFVAVVVLIGLVATFFGQRASSGS